MPAKTTLKIIKNDPRVCLPAYETQGAAGMDLRAFLEADVEIPSGGRAKITTGFKLEIPEGFEAQIRPRSGLALRNGVTVLNAPGTIDSDYRGDVDIILINLGQETFTVKNGDRIAQMIVSPVFRAEISETDTISVTERGCGGFGSTGK